MYLFCLREISIEIWTTETRGRVYHKFNRTPQITEYEMISFAVLIPGGGVLRGKKDRDDRRKS